MPLSYYVDGSISIIFAVAFICLLALTGARLAMNFTPSKSMYALLTLPVKRGHVFLAKLTSSLLAGFMLLAAQIALLLIFYALVGMRGASTFNELEIGRRYADLYLSLLDASFLRTLFPPDPFSLAFSLFGFGGTICVTLYTATLVKTGKWFRAMVLAAVWLALLLSIFPLTAYPRYFNLIKLTLMIVIPLITSVRGIKLFETGEVAG